MEKQDAEKVNIALLQVERQLKDLYEFVAVKDPENLEKFKHRFAKVLGHHIMALELPFWEQFPELKPEGLDGPFEIDQKIYNESPFK